MTAIGGLLQRLQTVGSVHAFDPEKWRAVNAREVERKPSLRGKWRIVPKRS